VVISPRGDVVVGATVRVERLAGGLIVDKLYSTESGEAVLANPLTTNAAGVFEFYLDSPQRVRLVVTAPSGLASSDGVVDVESPPSEVPEHTHPAHTHPVPTHDHGSADSGGLLAPSPALCEGRLSLDDAYVADVQDGTMVYFIPWSKDLIPWGTSRVALFDGARWVAHVLDGAKSISLAGLDANQGCDVFIYSDNGALKLELEAWEDEFTRSYDYNMAEQNGVWVKHDDPTRRYLGSFCTTVAGKTDDWRGNRLLYNQYNQIPREIYAKMPGDSFDCSNLNWERPAGNSTPGEGYIGYFVGMPNRTVVEIEYAGRVVNTGPNASMVGFSTSGGGSPNPSIRVDTDPAATSQFMYAHHRFQQYEGLYPLRLMVKVGGGTSTFQAGDAGMFGTITA
jgi:hypothetical protein